MSQDPNVSHVEITLPERVPLMIFPTALVFPNTLQPLRVFEPRYRTMLTWALERDRMFCLSQLRPGADDSVEAEDFFHIVGLGLIRACVGQEDGTSQLLLQGIARVQCTALEREGPFWTARIFPLRDHGHTDAENPALMDEVRTLAMVAASQAGPVPKEFPGELERLTDPGLLADLVGNSLVRDPMKRQELLEEENVAERLRRLRAMLRADLPL